MSNSTHFLVESDDFIYLTALESTGALASTSIFEYSELCNSDWDPQHWLGWVDRGGWETASSILLSLQTHRERRLFVFALLWWNARLCAALIFSGSGPKSLTEGAFLRCALPSTTDALKGCVALCRAHTHKKKTQTKQEGRENLAALVFSSVSGHRSQLKYFTDALIWVRVTNT